MNYKFVELTSAERLALDISASPRLLCHEKDTGREYTVINAAWKLISEPSVYGSGLYDGAIAVTPANSDLACGVTQGIYVGGTGNLAVRMLNGTEVTFKNVLGGHVHPLRVTRVLPATTATDILAIYC